MSTLTVSYRTVKDDLDLSDIAKGFGGGGHPKASGSRFDASIVNDILNNIFKQEDKLCGTQKVPEKIIIEL